MIRFVLPSWPPSTNGLYINGARKSRVLSPAGRAWIEETLWHMAAQRNEQRRRFGREGIDTDSQIVMAIRLYGRWTFKNGAWKKRDLSNAIKCLEDCAAKSLGFDDRQVFELRAEKIESDAERCELDIWVRESADIVAAQGA